MTTPSAAPSEADLLVRAHGPDLHRLAAMLTADRQEATQVTARTLAAATTAKGASAQPAPSTEQRLARDLVRRYLRSSRRRREAVQLDVGDDARDVLSRLTPRARAASALRLVEGWDAADTARALGVTTRRVERLVPSTPGLDLALTALADQHTLTGPALQDALAEALTETSHETRPLHRRRAWLAAAVGVLVLVIGYAVVAQPDDRGDEAAGAVDGLPGAGVDGGQVDLTEAGWVLDDDGDLPTTVMGLHLKQALTLDAGNRRGAIELPATGPMSTATFGVLWCDMPPTRDDNLAVPAGILTVADEEVRLPCAGRDGSPAVSQVTPLPALADGLLEITGDLPGKGRATLGVYAELDGITVPSPRGELTQAPALQDGALALDVTRAGPSFGGPPSMRLVQAVSVGADSDIRVWAGRTGAVSVVVDGTSVTDDGDLAVLRAIFEQWSASEGTDQLPDPSTSGIADWRDQQADVREGRWLVHQPGLVRTFELPAEMRPDPGERRTVVVEVITEGIGDHVQVAVGDARPDEVDARPVTAISPGDAPELVLGHRLVGRWTLPADGHLRDLRADSSADLPSDALVLATREAATQDWFGLGSGQGLVVHGDQVLETLWVENDLTHALLRLRDASSFFIYRSSGNGSVPDRLAVAVPAAPDHPPTTVLAYAPVPYEEFDFSAATTPPDTWPAGSDPPKDVLAPYRGATTGLDLQTLGTIGTEDLEDGRATSTFAVPQRGRVGFDETLVARITTKGPGRIRFLVDDQPAQALWATEGWWTSWTDDAVTSQVQVTYGGIVGGAEVELTVVVEDHEDVTVEVLTG